MVITYSECVPKLWNKTIEGHRREVREAVLDATARLVAERGLLSVTMSEIAEQAGIGRATLYKYFADVEAILDAWHQRQVAAHLGELAALRDQGGDACQRLEAVLEAYAFIAHKRATHGHPGAELAAILHRGTHITQAEHQVRDLIKDLLREASEAGQVRDDVTVDDLAQYCLYALTAAATLTSKTSVRRLAAVTLSGLRPPSEAVGRDIPQA